MEKRIKKKGKSIFVLLLLTSLLLCGCSADSSVKATMQDGEMAENIIQDEEADGNIMQSGDPDENITQGKDSDESITRSGSADKNAAPVIKLNEDITHIWNMYEYMDKSDDYENTELTVQLLKEKNLDASIVTDPVKTGGCTFTLPEGFEELPDMKGMYVNEHYPVDASTVYYTEKEMDASLQLMTQDTFTVHMTEELKQLYDSEVEVKVDTYEKTEIDGFPAFKILCSYSYKEAKITQLDYIINADKSYIIIYSQTDDYDRMEEFEESAETIAIKL